jgi:hypothetical protein
VHCHIRTHQRLVIFTGYTTLQINKYNKNTDKLDNTAYYRSLKLKINVQSMMLSLQRCSRVVVLLIAIEVSRFTQRSTLLVDCYSWGAGSCDAGGAVGGYHLESYEGQSNVNMSVPNGGIRCIRTGSLSGTGIHVTIGKKRVLSDLQEITDLQYGVDYEIQIYRLTSIFRGVLIRLSSSDSNTTDLTGNLYTTDPLLQMATTACSTPTVAVGVTHRSAVDKDLVYATLRFDNEQNVTSLMNTTVLYNLEITVVGMNNENGSVYAYSSYRIYVSGQASSTSEGTTMDGDSSGYDLNDDDALPQLDPNTENSLAGENPLQNADKAGSTPRDAEQSSSLVVGLTTIGGACFVAVLALLVRANLRRSSALNSPI